MPRQIVTITTAVVLAMASAASAKDIFTPSLNVAVDTADTVCTVLNTATKTAQDVTITIRDQDDNVRATLTDNIPPGGAQTVGDETPSNTQYCRVSGIGKNAARVTFCLASAEGGCTVAVTAP